MGLGTDATGRGPFRVHALDHFVPALVRLLRTPIGAEVAGRVIVMVGSAIHSVGEDSVVEVLLVEIEKPITIALGALAHVRVRPFDAEVIGEFLREGVHPVTHVGDTVAVVDLGVTLFVRVALVAPARGHFLGRSRDLVRCHTQVFHGTVVVEAAQGLSAEEGEVGAEVEAGMIFETVVQGHRGSQALVVVSIVYSFVYLPLLMSCLNSSIKILTIVLRSNAQLVCRIDCLTRWK